MNKAFGKVFICADGVEYGVIRETEPPFPDGLSDPDVIAEDACGNYFIVIGKSVCFWDHETSALTQLANSLEEFIAACSVPKETELRPEQIKHVWVDPEFAKEHGIKIKP